MIYTGTDDIYFLNDRNIAVGTEESCAAGFNAVPSQSAFVAKYGELMQADDDTNVSVAGISGEVFRYEQATDAQLKALSSWLSDRVETSCASICAAVEELQTSAQAHQEYISFLSGRVDERLCLSGGVLSNSLSVQNNIIAEKLFITNVQSGGTQSDNFTKISADERGFSVSVNGGRTIRLDAKDGTVGVIVGGQSLCSIVSAEGHAAKSYADSLKQQVVSADGELSSDSTVFGAKAYADAKSAAAEISAKSYADKLITDLTTSVTNDDAGSTVGSITETGGVVAATFRKIQVEQSQVTGLNEELSATSLKATDFVQWQSDADANYTILSSGSSGFVLSTDRPDVDISFGDALAMHRVRFGGQSLCAIISSDARRQIEGLDFAELTARPSQTIKSVRQDDGIVSAQVQDIQVAQSQVEGLTSDIAQISGNLTGDAEGSVNARIATLKGADSDLSTTVTVHGVRNYATQYIEQVSAHISATIYDKVRTAYRPMGSVSSYSVLVGYQQQWYDRGGDDECSAHIGEVYNNLSSTDKNPNISGQNFVFVKQVKDGNIPEFGWDELGGIVDFSNFYNKQEADQKAQALSVLLTGYVKHDVDALCAETKRLSSNADIVSSDLDSVKGYVHQLSAPFVDHAGTKGIVRQLSDDIVQTSAAVKDVSAHADALQGYVDYLSATPETAGRVGAVPRLSADVAQISGDVKDVSAHADDMQKYIHALSVTRASGEHTGIIQTLSDDISSLFVSNKWSVKFQGHVYHASDVSANTISGMFWTIDNMVQRRGAVLNGALYDVNFNDGISAETTDGLLLYRGDRIMILGEHDEERIDLKDLRENKWGHQNGNVFVYAGAERAQHVVKGDIAQEVLNTVSSNCSSYVSGYVSSYVEEKVSALTSTQDAILSVASELSGLKKVQMTGSYVGGGTFSVYVLSGS